MGRTSRISLREHILSTGKFCCEGVGRCNVQWEGNQKHYILMTEFAKISNDEKTIKYVQKVMQIMAVTQHKRIALRVV